MNERESHIHCAKVYLAQSRHFTHRARAFSFVLLSLAANCRKRAMRNRDSDVQMELFA